MVRLPESIMIVQQSAEEPREASQIIQTLQTFILVAKPRQFLVWKYFAAIIHLLLGASTDSVLLHSASTSTGSLNPENKGFKMLKAMGWSENTGLGKESQGIVAPVSNTIFSGLSHFFRLNQLWKTTRKAWARNKNLKFQPKNNFDSKFWQRRVIVSMRFDFNQN